MAAADGAAAPCPTVTDLPHAQAVVLGAVRSGALERLGEGGQRLLLTRVAEVAASPDAAACPPLAAAALAAVAACLDAVGDIPPDVAATLAPTLAARLGDGSASVRGEAAAALAALAAADPAGAAPLLASCLDSVASSADTLAAAAAAANVAPKPKRGRPCAAAADAAAAAAALAGAAAGAAALLAAAARLPLGVPTSLLTGAVTAAERLIAPPSPRPPSVDAPARVAGFTLLGAACAALPPALLAPRRLTLLSLWQCALPDGGPPPAAAEAPPSLLPSPDAPPWTAVALTALAAYAAGPLAAAPPTERARLARAAGAMLRAAPSPSPPAGGTPAALAAAAGLRARAALPDAAAYAADHAALARAGVRAVRGAAAVGNGAARRVLARRLARADASLGPGGPAGAPAGGVLDSAPCAPGTAALAPAWVVVAGRAGGDDGSSLSLAGAPTSAAEELLDAHVALLGAMLPSLSEANQEQVLAALAAAASAAGEPAGPATPRAPRARARGRLRGRRPGRPRRPHREASRGGGLIARRRRESDGAGRGGVGGRRCHARRRRAHRRTRAAPRGGRAVRRRRRHRPPRTGGRSGARPGARGGRHSLPRAPRRTRAGCWCCAAHVGRSGTGACRARDGGNFGRCRSCLHWRAACLGGARPGPAGP